MKIFNKIVNNKYYNFIINIIIILSITFILLEKFFNFNILTYNIILNIDIFIMIIFSIDFLFRFFDGGIVYFFKNYGWIDFLAAIPVLSPAIKGFKFFRIFRSIRFLRTARVIKLFKAINIKSDKIMQQMFLALSSTMILLMLILGGILVASQSIILSNNDLIKESYIIELADKYKDLSEMKKFLLEQEEVKEIMEIKEINRKNDFFKKVFRKNDTYTVRIKSVYVVFSREHSRRIIDIFEGSLIIAIFLITIIVLFVFMIQFNKLILLKLKE